MDTRLADRALAALLFCTAAAPVAAQQVATPPGMELSASFVSYDGGTSRVEFRGLKISQNDLSIAADNATVDSLDFKASAWKLSGDIRITAGTAEIASDEALLKVKDEMLATVELRGDPATFEQSATGRAETIEGRANRLFFDSKKRTLSLSEKAWLKFGGNEITGCDLIFDLKAETFSSGTTDCGERVRIRPAAAESAARRTAPP